MTTKIKKIMQTTTLGWNNMRYFMIFLEIKWFKNKKQHIESAAFTHYIPILRNIATENLVLSSLEPVPRCMHDLGHLMTSTSKGQLVLVVLLFGKFVITATTAAGF